MQETCPAWLANLSRHGNITSYLPLRLLPCALVLDRIHSPESTKAECAYSSEADHSRSEAKRARCMMWMRQRRVSLAVFERGADISPRSRPSAGPPARRHSRIVLGRFPA